MAKQLNVDLHFSADTSSAKKAIAELQAALTNLPKLELDASASGFTQQIAQGTIEANKLRVALEQAVNVKTGALDLSKLSQSLSQAGTSINQVTNSLISMGPVGQRTFQQFAATIAQAQMPAMRLNGLMGEMWTTLKNVARFQISSSIIHGLVGGIQSAFTYAQNLNESLNNIRIVTGDSSEKMAQFARDANTAAKELSTTTLDYTKASLIYYQQGLNDQQVKERTDVTVKLANVSRQSAQAVSDQMTAIWENFDNGSQSLEYFADVITALGATTASSSQEIAKGLEKFAPVAKTIGLSYETATAALATIVANTRQSADSVGTGLRTIFSRFENLKLGKTLEDGVDLTKYTKALKTVGVEVLDVNGKLKDADTIIFDLADKWKLLDNTQKTALATTVGGVRQYSTLMALFNNWDDMMTNLNTASGSEGTLQSQADIYAESWEAARNRVQTALQGLYDTLINDDAFINILNGVEKLISGIDNFVQSIGGAKGAILGISSAVLTFANAGVSNSISNMVYNLKSLTGIGQKEADQTRQALVDKALSLNTKGSPVVMAEGQALKNQISLQQTLNTYGKQYNDIQRQIAQTMIQTQTTYDNEVIASEKELKNIQDQLRAKRLLREELEHNTKAKNEQLRVETQIKELEQKELDLQQRASTAKRASASNLKSTNTALQNLSISTMTGADMFAGILAGATSAAFAVTALNNTIKTLTDESATTGQQLSAMFINLPMIITSATASFNSFSKVWQGFSNNFTQKALTPIEALGKQFVGHGNIGGKAEKGSQTVINALKSWGTDNQAEVLAQKGIVASYTANQEKSLAAMAKATGLRRANLESIIKETMASEAYAAASETEKNAILEAAIAEEAGAKAKLATLGTYALIIAAVLAVAAAIYFMVQAYNADANAAKKAAEAHQALQQKSQEAQQELSSIKDAFQGYDDAVAALEECTKGTEEWNEALKKVNDQVLSILENHPELAGRIQTERDSNGMLRITNEEEILTQAEKKAQNARYAALASNVSALEAQYKSDETNFKRRFQYQKYTDYDGENHEITNELGVKGDLDGLLQGIKAGLVDAADTSGFVESLKRFGIELTDSVDIDTFRNAVLELSNSFQNLGQVTENTANVIAESQLNNQFGGAEKEIASEAYESAYADIYKNALNFGKNSIGIGSNKGNSTSLVDFWDRYSSATGTNFQLAQNAVTGFANNRYFQYLDNGETKKISVEEAAAAIAASEALTTLGASAQEAATAFANLENNEGKTVSVGENKSFTIAENTSDIMRYAVAHNGSLESATVGEFQEIKSQVSKFKDELDSEGNVVKTALQQWLEAIGLDLPEQIVEQIQNSLDNLDPTQIGKNLSPTAQAAFESIFGQSIKDGMAKDMKIEELQAMASVYQDTFTKLGASGLAELNSIFSDIGKEGHLSAEQAEALRSVLTSFDWSTAGPGAFRQALLDTGVAGLDSCSGVLAFADAMRRASQTGLESAQSIYKAINPLISEVKEGKQYSPEQWAEFAKQGISGIDEFFSIMPDGSRILVGNAEEFYNIVSGQLAKNFEDAIGRAQEYLGNINEFQGQFQIDSLKTFSREYATANKDTVAFDKDSVATEGINKMLEAIALTSESGLSETFAAYQDRLNNGEGITGAEFLEIQDAFRAAIGDAQTWDEFKSHLSEAAQKGLEEAQQAASNQEWYNEATKAGLDPSEIIAYANELQKLNTEFKNNRELALTFATTIKKQEAGIKSLKSNISSWKTELQKLGPVLKNNGVGLTTAMSEAAQGARRAISNLLDVPIDSISDDFITNSENLALMEEAANGSTEAILALGRSFAASKIKENGFTGTTEELNTLLENLQKDADGNTLKIGVSLDSSGALDDLQSLTQQSAMTAEQISANLSAAGWKPTITYEDVPFTVVSSSEDGYSTVTYTDSNGLAYTRTIESSSVPQGVNSTMSLPVIDGGNTKFKGGGGGGSQGGGGGGGGKQKKKDAPKQDRGARYHEVDRQQNQNKKRQDAASKTADRTIGKIHEKQLERQIKLEEKALELSRRRLHEAQQYINEDKKALDEALKKAKVGKVKLDEDGNIENYEELMKELYEREKALVEKYNKGKLSDEEYEKQKKAIDEAKEAMDNYEESIDAAQEAAEAMVESIQNMIDKRLEKIKYDIEFQIEINDNDLKIMQHLFDKLDEENPHTIAQRIANLSGQSDIQRDNGRKLIEERDRTMRQIADDVATYSAANMADLKANNKDEYKKRKEELDALLLTLGLTEKEWNKLTDEEKANYLAGSVYKDQLQEISDGLLEVDANLDEITKQITDALLDALDQLYDKFTQQAEAINTLNDVLSSYSDIMDLTRNAIGAKAADAMIANLRTQKIGNLTTKTQRDYEFYNRIKQERALLAVELEREDLVGKEREAKEKMYDSLLEKEREAQQAYLSDATETLQLIQEKAEEAQEKIMENFRNAMLGGDIDDIEWFNTVYDRQKTLEDSTVEDYEKLYRLSEMEHQSNKLLDNLDNPKYRKEVLEFQKKLNEQKKANYEMSQAELTVEQKYLDLLQARIALEEAQNAKSTVRLQRDNEGNWGYVFTNDADTIEDAEAQAQKALYEYQKALDDSNNEIIDRLKDFNSELADEMDQLRDKYNRSIIDKKTFEAESARLKKLAQDQLTFYAQQYAGFASLLGMTKEEMLALYGVTDGELPDDFGKTLLARLAGYDSMQDMIDAMMDGIDDTRDGIISTEETRQAEQDALLQQMGMSLDTLISDINTQAGQVDKDIKQISIDLGKFSQDFTTTFNAGYDEAEKYWNKLPDIADDQSDILETVGEIADYIRDMAYAGDHEGDRTQDEQKNIIQRLLEQQDGLEIKFNTDGMITKGLYDRQINNSNSLDQYKAIKDLQAQLIDTVDASRQAFLAGLLSPEEYEDFMDTLTTWVRLQAQTASYGFGDIMPGQQYRNDSSEVIEQNVHIDANFPNVTSSSEIEEAFNNLVNKAAQFANRKRQG